MKAVCYCRHADNVNTGSSTGEGEEPKSVDRSRQGIRLEHVQGSSIHYMPHDYSYCLNIVPRALDLFNDVDPHTK